MTQKTSQFQQLIDAIEQLEPDDQALLISIIRRRLIERRRAELAAEVAEGREAYQRGDVRRGSAADLIEELLG